jgi:hypothetical protein
MSKIGLWGASGSGKTSFLAALYVAANQNADNWRIIGVDQESVDFLTRMTDALTRRRIFPDKTEGIQNLGWTVVGETERTVGGRFRKRTEKVPLRFQLDLIDAAGGLFKGVEEGASDLDDDLELDFDENRAEEAAGSDADQLVAQLAECDGLVYLFDPLRERENGDEFQHFQWALQHISFRCEQDGRFDSYLPHRLAVCVTKLDDPKVFHTAKQRGYLTADPKDPFLFPRVRADRAENLYLDLSKVSPTRSALMVHDAIRKYFRPERVRYFATSSVGFFVGNGATRFQAANFQNVVPDRSNGRSIRGGIHPINVLEPLLWLAAGGQADR